MEPSLTLLPTPDRTNIVEAGALLKTHDYDNQPVIGGLSPTVEVRRLELLTSALQRQRSTN